MVKNYDISVLYHSDKANVVADTLSWLSMGSVSHVGETKKVLVKDVHRFARLGVRLEDSPNGGFMTHHKSESSLVVEVESKQLLDQSLMKFNESVLRKLNDSFSLGGDSVLRYQGRLCIPNVDGLRNWIGEEAYGSHYHI